MSIYNAFFLEIKVRDKIYGGLPGNKEIFDAWMKTKFDDPENTENTATDLDLDKEIEENTSQFRCDDNGIYIAAYQVKAMMAQCASLLKITTSKRGSKQTLREGSQITGIDADGNFTAEKVYMLPLRTEPDGIDSFTGNVSGPQGSRSIISNTQFALQPTLRMRIEILGIRMQEGNRGNNINVEDLEAILELGQNVGLGSVRKFDAGMFDVVKFCTWEEYTEGIAAG